MKTAFISIILAIGAAAASASLDCSTLQSTCRHAQGANQAFCSAQYYACGKCLEGEKKCLSAGVDTASCSAQRVKCAENIPRIKVGNANVAVSSSLVGTTLAAPVTSSTTVATATATAAGDVTSTIIATATTKAVVTTPASVPRPPVAPAANTTSVPPPSGNGASGLSASSITSALVLFLAAALTL